MHLKLTDITIPTRRRAIDNCKVVELADSIRQIGLLNPVTVTQDYTLIAGAHRVEAVKLLGWDAIDATVTPLSGLHAELAEIDENLVRNDLHYVERGEQLARRKEVYEDLHPETKQGVKQAAGMNTSQGNNVSEIISPTFTEDTAAKIGTSRRTIEQEIQIAQNLTPAAKEAILTADIPKTDALKLARMEPEKQEAIAAKLSTGEAKTIADAQREAKREDVMAKLEDIAVEETKAAQGVYDVIVIDPPWPMQKIERDVRPEQVAFDYPTMTEDELKRMAIPAADACHIWLWTTHKYIAMAFRLLEEWGMKYVCTFVWHKPGGFQPFGLPQYNCEFALYARKGSPNFINTKAFPTCFNAPRGAHSEKPEVFYEIVRRVTSGRRLDMFNRRGIDGFDVWGKEAAI